MRISDWSSDVCSSDLSKATAHFNPEWHVKLDKIDSKEKAMALDAFATSHPVIQKIQTVDQTSQAFDSITYQKGEAAITMMEGFAGADVWRVGLRNYIKNYAYHNTVTDPMLAAVEAAGAKGTTKKIARESRWERVWQYV